jgi:hypothetical protein
MASAPTQPGNGSLPAGFKSPFSVVTQTGSHDDLLAVVAVLTGKTLQQVFDTAVTLGMRRFNYYVDEVLVKKLLFSLSPLTIGPCREVTSIAALPEVCILLIDYDSNSETGRLRLPLLSGLHSPSIMRRVDPGSAQPSIVPQTPLG